MPIFVYRCVNCKTNVEKITLKPVKDTTLPPQIIEPCTSKKCAGATTRHRRVVTAPSYVGLTPPATSKRVTRMSQVRPARDVNWKNRIKQGLNPDGKRLSNLRKQNRQEWESTVKEAFPDLKEKQQEVVGRARKGEFGTIYDATRGNVKATRQPVKAAKG
jgi:hypothetical protein